MSTRRWGFLQPLSLFVPTDTALTQFRRFCKISKTVPATPYSRRRNFSRRFAATSTADRSNRRFSDGLIFGVGNPMLDVIAEVSPEFVVKHGLEPDNGILGTDRQRTLIESMLKNYPIDYQLGGSCLNTLRGCQWLLNEPRVTSFTGCIGDDEHGWRLRTLAREAGVDAKFHVDNEHATGTCAVLLTTDPTSGRKLRSLCAFPNAAEQYDKYLLTVGPDGPFLMDCLQKAMIYYITGFFLSHSVHTSQMVARYAAHHPARTAIFNLSAPFVPTQFRDNVMKLMLWVDILFGNKSEVLALASSCGFHAAVEHQDEAEIARLVANLPYAKRNIKPHGRIIVITNGCEPTLVYHERKVLKPFPVTQVKKVVDSNGAGDAFVGGFLSQMALNDGKVDIDACMQAANYLASVVVQQHGCTYGEVAESHVDIVNTAHDKLDTCT